MVTLLWLRQDLRLQDNLALLAACKTGGPVVPVYILDEDCAPALGGASRWWLHQSLKSLSDSLAKKGSRIVLRKGGALDVLKVLVHETGARSLFWGRCYEPAVIERDKKIKSHFTQAGLQVESFNNSLLFEPWEIKTGQKTPYQVYTAFWNTCNAAPSPAEPLPAPSKIPAPDKWPSSLDLKDFKLEPRIPWDKGMREAWEPGEKGARKNLSRFAEEAASDYETGRDIPSARGTSRISPHLHFGEISVRQIWRDVRKMVYRKEIVWREFAYHLLYHFPATVSSPLKKKFEKFPWRKDKAGFKAWSRGLTGYPIVDAGMRELWGMGWMHNRVRMIVASFLVKDLLIPWQEGAAWFWDTLVDADLASNTLGWQWTAGCGADAAPFFRIFNPVSQGEKFDPHGSYVRKWVPELKALPDKYLHRPFEAPDEILEKAGVKLGKNYPKPVVDHADARKQALIFFDKIRA